MSAATAGLARGGSFGLVLTEGEKGAGLVAPYVLGFSTSMPNTQISISATSLLFVFLKLLLARGRNRS